MVRSNCEVDVMTIRQIGSRVWLLSAPDISITFTEYGDAIACASVFCPPAPPTAEDYAAYDCGDDD